MQTNESVPRRYGTETQLSLHTGGRIEADLAAMTSSFSLRFSSRSKTLRPSSATCSLSSRIRLSFADNKSLPGQRKSIVLMKIRPLAFSFFLSRLPYKRFTDSPYQRYAYQRYAELAISRIVDSKESIFLTFTCVSQEFESKIEKATTVM